MVGTLLHELVHNIFGNHGPKFRKMLQKVTKECEDHMVEKLFVRTIHDCGTRLGGDQVSVEKYTQRELSLFAAECRLAEVKSELKQVNFESVPLVEAEVIFLD